MNTQHFGSCEQVNPAAGATRFFAAFGAGDSGAVTSEAHVQAKAFSPGTISLFGAYFSSHDRANTLVRVRVNTGNGSGVLLTITGSGQFEDSSNTQAIADNDLVNHSIVYGAGGTTSVLETFWATWAPSSGTQAIIASGRDTGTLTGTADLFLPMTGFFDGVTTAANAQNTIATAGTLQAMNAYLASNTRSDTTVFKPQISGISGNLGCSFGATVTGLVEDVSTTDSVADGDELGYIWDNAGGTGQVVVRLLKIEVSATNAYPIFCSPQTNAGLAQSFGLTHYQPISGRFHAAETTENDAEAKSNQALTMSDLYAYVSAYSLNSGNYRLRLRVSRTDGNNTVAFTGTGQQGDTVNTDAVVDEDELNYSSVTGGTSGSATLRTLSLLATPGAGGGGSTPIYLRRRLLLGMG